MYKINFSKLTLTLLFLSFLIGNIVFAGTASQIIDGLKLTGKTATFSEVEFAPAWMAYINGFLGVMGLLFMIFIIYAGYLWMTARGNDEQVDRAKKMITQGVIGLAIIIGARLLVELALSVLSYDEYPIY